MPLAYANNTVNNTVNTTRRTAFNTYRNPNVNTNVNGSERRCAKWAEWPTQRRWTVIIAVVVLTVIALVLLVCLLAVNSHSTIPAMTKPATPTPATSTALPKNCEDVFRNGSTTSGVYSIYPDGQNEVEVVCEQDLYDGGWMVFQQRVDGSEDFFKTWNEYKNGFGNVTNEFWLGNENLHLLTSDNSQKLKIEMKFYNETAIVDYASFRVGSESEKYRLHVAGYSGSDPPGDSLLDHANQPFSTKDQDNDAFVGNCARQFSGAWWYKQCYESNLNGIYGEQSNVGILWRSWKGTSTSLTSVRMMIKPVTVYRDCHAAYNNGKTKSGVYRISPDGVTEIDVYCEQEQDSGGWTVFQHRFDGSINFNRTWDQYKRGFGTIDTEYWLGNHIIHLMTVNQDQKMSVELGFRGRKVYAYYDEFWIKNEANKYQINVGGFSKRLGNPGDSLSPHNGKYFSTHDNDHDGWSGGDWAALQNSAWWYNNCSHSDLNGPSSDKYYYWDTWKSYLDASRMMIKTK